MKVSKNAPCPCGSGKKYKKCCMLFADGEGKVDESRIFDKYGTLLPEYTACVIYRDLHCDGKWNMFLDTLRRDGSEAGEDVLKQVLTLQRYEEKNKTNVRDFLTKENSILMEGLLKKVQDWRNRVAKYEKTPPSNPAQEAEYYCAKIVAEPQKAREKMAKHIERAGAAAVPILMEIAADELMYEPFGPGMGVAPVMAISLLGRLKAEPAVNLLAGLLSHEMLIVREEAFSAMVEIGAPAIDGLIAILDKRPVGDAQLDAAAVLAEIGCDQRIYDAAFKLIGEGSFGESPEMLSFAADMLSACEDPKAVEVLTKLLDDPDLPPDVKDDIGLALEEITDGEFEYDPEDDKEYGEDDIFDDTFDEGDEEEDKHKAFRGMERHFAAMNKIVGKKGLKEPAEINAYLEELRESGENMDFIPETPEEEAQELIWRAWELRESDIAGRIGLAKKALEIYPDCADAWVILGDNAADAHEAFKCYKKGMEAGEKYLGADFFEKEAGHFWGIMESRPYMRARLAVAQCLIVLNRRQEAAKHFAEILRLNPDDNQGVRIFLEFLLIEMGKDAEALSLIDEYKEDGMIWKLYSAALLAFRKEGDSPDAREKLKSAVDVNKYVPDYLLGRKHIPKNLPGYYQPRSREEAMIYASEAARGWDNTIGALNWLKKTAK